MGYDYFDGTHLSVGVGIFHQLAGNAGIAGTENYAEYQYRYRFGSFLSHDEVVKFASSAFLKDYIDQMVAKLGDINKDKITILDERKLTNIGIFRYYMDAWIEANPDINTNMTHMVRQLQPGPTGMPIQIYCFSAIQEWVTYEKSRPIFSTISWRYYPNSD